MQELDIAYNYTVEYNQSTIKVTDSYGAIIARFCFNGMAMTSVIMIIPCAVTLKCIYWRQSMDVEILRGMRVVLNK